MGDKEENVLFNFAGDKEDNVPGAGGGDGKEENVTGQELVYYVAG